MKNIDDMSREDNISQLFIKNQHKLEEMPPSSVWERIESRLDDSSKPFAEAETVKQSSNWQKIKRLIPYMAAAAVLLLLIVSIPYLIPGKKDNPIAEKLVAVEDVIITDREETMPMSEAEKKNAFETKDRIQQEKILETAKKSISDQKNLGKMSEDYDLDRIEINETSEDLIVLSVDNYVEEEKSFIAKPKAENNDLFGAVQNSGNMTNVVNRSEYQLDGRSYADPPSVILNDKVETLARQNSSSIKQQANSTKPIMKNKSQKKDNVQRLEGKMQIFEWILGQWIDLEEEGGVSTENWRRINNYSIECLATKIKDKNKIFEERLTIYFDQKMNQVFLKMPVDDYKKSMLFMLVSYDTENIVFEQREDPVMPDKVIFQRSINGFSTIITKGRDNLKPAQQSYFEQRNRVSNTRILRLLSPNLK